MKRTIAKRNTAKAAALVMTLLLTAFTLMMSGCSSDTATKSGSGSDTASAVEWEYVSPSDLSYDTDDAGMPGGDATNGQEQNGQPPQGEPPEKQGGPDTQSYDYNGEASGKLTADGETVVKGDSDITVTVTGDYGTEVSVPEDAGLDTKVLDRSEFDEYYETSTQFGTNK